MSRYQLLASIFVLIAGGFLGYNGVHWAQSGGPEKLQTFFQEDSQNRFIASQPMMAKIGSEQNSRYFFDVKIDTDHLALHDQDISEIRIQVTALRPLPAGLSYQWHIDQDSVVTEGAIQGQLPALGANESHDLILKLRGFSKEQKRFLNLELHGDVGLPLQRKILISSRIEDSFEYAIQQEELKQRQADQKPQGQSVVPPSGFRGRFAPENVIR